MPLVTEDGFAPDPWLMVDAVEALPASGAAIVPLDRLAAALAAKCAQLGVLVDPAEPIEPLLGHLERIQLVAIRFNSFADGRGFSTARRLRRAGFRGILRAQGDLLADQFAFARACGFDQIVISDNHAARHASTYWREGLGAISRGYQRGMAGLTTIADLRHGGTAQSRHA